MTVLCRRAIALAATGLAALAACAQPEAPGRGAPRPALHKSQVWEAVLPERRDGQIDPRTLRLRDAAELRAAALGDLEGDGQVDVLVARPGRAGIQRLDARGRLLWRREDVDVRQIALVDADGDGRLEILHSQRQGAFVLRERDGSIRTRFETGDPARRFAVVAWPDPARPQVLQRAGDETRLWTLDGVRSAALAAPAWNVAGAVEAQVFQPFPDAVPWLAVLDRLEPPGLSVLAVYDGVGRRVLDDVLDEPCDALGSAESGQALLVGCGARVWRYARAGRTLPVAIEPVERARASGDAFGPLSFGDSEERVRGRRALLPGHRCRGRRCTLGYVELEGRELLLVPEFAGGRLVRVLLLGLPEPETEYRGATYDGWRALVRIVGSEAGRASSSAPVFPAPETVAAAAPDRGWRAQPTHAWRSARREIEVGVLTADADGPLQYAPYALFAPGKRTAAEWQPPASGR